ncbi:glycerophosphodiester phosphodiesterase [Lactobacillus sp. PV012]|uniref:glycerophosphodiester phosphodiesterase n=1 Tax=Lactobacillus sp. PV012 TaxID=2594494 RepID=UPI00223F1F1C|nr:glycerophosphodiester phosphodiesterase family protein [Lactobacillus sp. PV012]QNQ82475.1 glycerophosphodiester phosphodiesterase [Lactobacillus sp. PV012]
MKKLIILFFLTIFPFVCGMMNIAHRGDSDNGKTVEHSWFAYDRAVCARVNYLELDLQETNDHVLVLSHDDNLSRVFGVDRKISDITYQELSQYENRNGQHILKLNDVFQRYQGNSKVKFMIEPKSDSEADCKQLVDLIKKYHLQKRILFESFSKDALATLKQLAPEIPRAQLAGDYQSLATSEYYVSDAYQKSVAEFLTSHDKGYLLWGINKVKQMHKFMQPDKLVTGILTDNPVELAMILSRRNHLVPVYSLGDFPPQKINGHIIWKGTMLTIDSIKLVNDQLYYHVTPGIWVEASKFYEKNANAPKSKSGLIHVSKITPVYTDLTFTHAAGKTLRANSYWNYYAVAKTNGKTAYNLGGDQWIK